MEKSVDQFEKAQTAKKMCKFNIFITICFSFLSEEQMKIYQRVKRRKFASRMTLKLSNQSGKKKESKEVKGSIKVLNLTAMFTVRYRPIVGLIETI